jgi:hypothetical protein
VQKDNDGANPALCFKPPMMCRPIFKVLGN